MDNAVRDKELIFNPKHFVSAGYETADGDYSNDERTLINNIRLSCPELSDWGDLPIGVAWGDYSQNVYLVSWLEESQVTINRESLAEFLAYIYWHEVNGEPRSSLMPEELSKFAKVHSFT